MFWLDRYEAPHLKCSEKIASLVTFDTFFYASLFAGEKKKHSVVSLVKKMKSKDVCMSCFCWYFLLYMVMIAWSLRAAIWLRFPLTSSFLSLSFDSSWWWALECPKHAPAIQRSASALLIPNWGHSTIDALQSHKLRDIPKDAGLAGHV